MKNLFFVLIVFVNAPSLAQVGTLGQIATNAIANREKAQLGKHVLFNTNLTYPVSIGRALDGSKLVLPPIYLSAEYGIYENITIGLMAGTMTTESSGTITKLINDAQSGNFDINNIDFANLLQSLLFGGGEETYRIKNTSILLGGTLKYNFVGGEKLNLFIANRTGIKLRTLKKEYASTGVELVDQLANVAESTSGFFSSFSFGGNYYLNNSKSWAISPEIGWGPGWGDGITLSNNPMLLTIGATYHFRPATKK